MGVKGFFQLLQGETITLKELRGKTVAIDCMTEIYRALFGAKMLTDALGNNTAYLNAMLQNAVKFRKAGIKQLYVFDSDEPVKEKACELAKRRSEGRERVTGDMIKNIMQMLDNMGFSYMVAPKCCDAEHLCAVINARGLVDYIITTDADAFLYGAKSVIKYEKRQMVLYTRDMVKQLANPPLSDDDIIRLGVCMGTDFCTKSKGIGLKTVVAKCRDAQLNEDQEAAMVIFKRNCEIPKYTTGKADHDALLKLYTSKGFSRDRIAKIIS